MGITEQEEKKVVSLPKDFVKLSRRKKLSVGLEYFLKADEFGDEWAYINVARIYREGKGNLKPDGLKLVEYLTKKLEQNESPDENIIYEIAQAYEEGCGNLKPDAQRALEFYRKAATFSYLGG